MINTRKARQHWMLRRPDAKQRRDWPQGFTLIETLVAIVLLLVLVGGVFVFGDNVLNTRNRISLVMKQDSGVRILFDSLQNNINTCLVSDGQEGAGIEGDQNHLKLVSRGVDLMSLAQAEMARSDASQASTFPVLGAEDSPGAPDSESPAPGGGVSESNASGPDENPGAATAFRDVTATTYRWDNSIRTLHASRTSNGQGGDEAAILSGIGRVRFRYHNGSAWADSFNSQSGNRLPVAIEVSIWFTTPPEIAQMEEQERLEREQQQQQSTRDGSHAENKASNTGMFPSGSDNPALSGPGRFSTNPDSTSFLTGRTPNPASENPDGEASSADLSSQDIEALWGKPDRVRVFVIPDGPDFSYGRSYTDSLTGESAGGTSDAPGSTDTTGGPSEGLGPGGSQP